jgi:hypothetical protein
MRLQGCGFAAAGRGGDHDACGLEQEFWPLGNAQSDSPSDNEVARDEFPRWKAKDLR